MPTTIEVKTQRIVVNPPSGRIDVYGYGPAGPPGPTGPVGPAGPIGWPLVAPATVDGNIQFTPSNTNLQGLRSTTDANTYMKFGAGPPAFLQLKANSGATPGDRGGIYLDADTVMFRSGDAGLTHALFTAGGINPFIVNRQGGTHEGGEIAFQGGTSFPGSIYIDRYGNDFRFVQVGGNIISFVNGTINANAVNIAGSAAIGINAGSIVYLGNASDARVWIGNDAEFIDAGQAHTIGLRSLTDSNRGYLLLGGGARLMGLSGYYHLSAPGGGDAYYDANNHYFRSQAGGGQVTIQGDRITFVANGGGWFMQDTTWIRSVGDKNVWLGAGFFGANGGIAIGTGGTTNTTYRAYFQANVFSTSQTNSYEFEARAASSDSWSSVQPFRANPSSGQAGLTLHPGGVAPMIKVYQNTNQIEFHDAGTGWTGTAAAYFTVVSSLRYKSDVIDLPLPRPVDVARVLQPIWFRAPNDLIEPIPIYSDEDEHMLVGSDYTTHTCGESPHCSGTPENPCSRMDRYLRGRVSLSAEQVERVFPTIAQYNHKGELTGYDVVGLVALLVGAIRNLADDVDILKHVLEIQ